MEVRYLDDDRVVNVPDDDPVARALIASGKAREIQPGGIHDRYVDAPAEVQETPEKPGRRGRRSAEAPETR